MKIEFSSQRRKMLLFLITNMAAVTSRTNQQNSARLSTFLWRLEEGLDRRGRNSNRKKSIYILHKLSEL